MTIKLHYHPLSSFCQKVLIALYENDTPFVPNIVDFGDSASRDAFLALWPVGRFPVITDEGRDWMVPESSIIIEYLAQHYPGKSKLIPDDPDAARQCRMRDRFFDLYVNVQMQKIITDRLRPEDQHDAFGVEQARALMKTALDMIDEEIKSRTWAMGDQFSMADCAAAPALFYADIAQPFSDTHRNAYSYLQRLKNRPSYARVLKEAEPYLKNVPK